MGRGHTWLLPVVLGCLLARISPATAAATAAAGDELAVINTGDDPLSCRARSEMDQMNLKNSSAGLRCYSYMFGYESGQGVGEYTCYPDDMAITTCAAGITNCYRTVVTDQQRRYKIAAGCDDGFHESRGESDPDKPIYTRNDLLNNQIGSKGKLCSRDSHARIYCCDSGFCNSAALHLGRGVAAFLASSLMVLLASDALDSGPMRIFSS